MHQSILPFLFGAQCTAELTPLLGGLGRQQYFCSHNKHSVKQKSRGSPYRPSVSEGVSD